MKKVEGDNVIFKSKKVIIPHFNPKMANAVTIPGVKATVKLECNEDKKEKDDTMRKLALLRSKLEGIKCTDAPDTIKKYLGSILEEAKQLKPQDDLDKDEVETFIAQVEKLLSLIVNVEIDKRKFIQKFEPGKNKIIKRAQLLKNEMRVAKISPVEKSIGYLACRIKNN